MRWLKGDIWKVGITLVGILLLLVLMVWVPVSAAGADEGASGLATPVTVTVQATPTVDATVTALNKEKLAQEIQQLKNQNEQFKNQNASDFFVWLPGWLRTNAATLLSTLIVVIGGLIGLFRWFGDRRNEREKRAEERFQAAVTGLGDEKEGLRIGAAILLRTFLRPGYEQFYTQIFDLAVAHLCLPRTPAPPPDQDGILPQTPLSHALLVVFRDAFPRARKQLQGSNQPLDAAGILLDYAYLVGADLQQIWMPGSFLRKADLKKANLSGADLRSNFLSGADLRGAKLIKADLNGADLSNTNIEEASSLKDTDLRGVKGLTKKQKDACKAKGAIIDVDSTTSPPQSPVSPSPPSQSNDTQAPIGPNCSGEYSHT